MLGNFSIFIHPYDMSSLFLKEKGKFMIRLQGNTGGRDKTNTTLLQRG